MLDHEEYIKQDREQAKTKLGRISKNGTPVIIVIRNQKHLDNTEGASSEVKKYISNTPSRSTLSPEVHDCLGNVLDEGDSKLDIGAVVEEVQPGDDTGEREYQADTDEDGNATQNTPADFGHFLRASLKQDALKYGDSTGKDGMESKDDII